jgi:two-component system LytT family sensor kinase
MKKSIIISLHVAFWFITIFNKAFAPYILSRFLSITDYGHAYEYVSYFPPLFFYIFYFYIFGIIKNKKILIYCAFLILATVFVMYIINSHSLGYSVVFISSLVAWGIMGGLFRFFVDWMNKDKVQLQLSRQNLQSELALLRTQINPHFLFNSLHNIDTLILVNPQKASDSLIKLSDLMRYTLYDADTEFIELSKEIDYIKKYINLQELRLTNKNLISFTVEGSVQIIKVAPMLFISFIENAFKHITDKEVEAGISIQFKITEHRILFNVTNAFDLTKSTVKDETSGIGLDNVKRRLELIYPESHKLDISTYENRYKVELTIDR